MKLLQRVTVDGSLYWLQELPDGRWQIELDGEPVGEVCRSKGEALSAAISLAALSGLVLGSAA